MSKIYKAEESSAYTVESPPLIMQIMAMVSQRVGIQSGADNLTFDAIRKVDPDGSKWRTGFNWNALLASWDSSQVDAFWHTIDELAAIETAITEDSEPNKWGIRT